MERLTKLQVPASPGEARLAELVGAAEPASVAEAQKRRTLAAILERRSEHQATGPFALRFALAAGILLVAGAATAGFGVRRWRAETAPTAALAVAPPPVHRPQAHPPTHPIAVAAPEPEPVAPPEPMAAPAPQPAPALHARAPRSEDPARVVAALRVLRQDHDPDRAGRLLAAYLHTYPHGALAEEATALSIEAADARHSPAALGFARRYLREFPQGRFHQTAERVLARAQP